MSGEITPPAKKMDRRLKWKIRRYQRGECVNCGHNKHHRNCGETCAHSAKLNPPHKRGIKSPYTKLCIPCAVARRSKLARFYNMQPWKPGHRGRPPKVKVKANLPENPLQVVSRTSLHVS